MPIIDLAAAAWRKSSYSSGNSNRVEVASGDPAWAAVRDSKIPAAGALVVPAHRFGRLVDALRADR